MLYAIRGNQSRDLLSWRGLTIVHDNKAELEWIISGDVRIVPCPTSIPIEQRIQVRDHPDFASYRWPLKKEDFRR